MRKLLWWEQGRHAGKMPGTGAIPFKHDGDRNPKVWVRFVGDGTEQYVFGVKDGSVSMSLYQNRRHTIARNNLEIGRRLPPE